MSNSQKNIQGQLSLADLLTNNGRVKPPADVHKIIMEEYGITSKWEWEVAHFFIGFDHLIFTYAD